jgi:nitroreductase
MDTFTAIASKRDARSYAADPIPGPTVERILQAGRVSGSAKNRQERRFVVLETTREQASAAVTRPSNLQRATLAIAIVTSDDSSWTGFDVGRASQNMMLAAWNDGVTSCPNAIADQDLLHGPLGLGEGERVAVILSFGQNAGRDPEAKSAEAWVEGADREPLDDLVTRV